MSQKFGPEGIATVSRRQVLRWAGLSLATVGVGGALAACGDESAASSSGAKASGALPEPTTLRVSSSKIDNYLIDEVLKQQEIFPKYNLEVPEYLYPSSGVQGAQLMAAGTVDAAQQDTILVLTAYANAQAGSQPAIVGMRIPETTYSIVANDGKWPDKKAGFEEWMAALKGKTVGVTAIGAGADHQLRLALSEAGMKYEDVTPLAVGLPTAAVAQINGGQIDAYVGITWATSRFIAEATGGSVLFDFTAESAPDIIKNQQVQPLVVRQEIANDQQDVVIAWLNAQEEAKSWIIDNPDKAAEIVNTSFLGGQSAKVAKDYVSHFVDVVVPKIQPMFKVQKDAMDLMIDVAVQQGSISEGQVTYEDIVAEFARA